MNISLSKNKIKEFCISGLLIFSHLLSCIPILEGSLFDFFLLPLIFPLCILIKNYNKKYNLLSIVVFLFLGFSLLLHNLSFLNYIAWLLRLTLPFSLLYIFNNNRSEYKNKNELNSISKILFYFQIYFVIITLISLLSFFGGFLDANYYSIGFPFYANGTDRHVFGPALAYLTIINLHSLIKLKTPFQKKYFYFILIGNVFTFLVSVTIGSRASIIVYLFYLFFVFCKYLIQKTNILSRSMYLSFSKNLISLLVKSLFFTLIIVSFSIYLFYTQTNDSFEYFSWLIRRSFQFNFELTNDISRGPIFDQINLILRNPIYFLFPTYFVNLLDSGFLLFTYIFGLIGFSLFSLLWVISFKNIEINKISFFIVSSSYFYFLLNAPHIMLPRFWLVIILPILLNI